MDELQCPFCHKIESFDEHELARHAESCSERGYVGPWPAHDGTDGGQICLGPDGGYFVIAYNHLGQPELPVQKTAGQILYAMRSVMLRMDRRSNHWRRRSADWRRRAKEEENEHP